MGNFFKDIAEGVTDVFGFDDPMKSLMALATFPISFPSTVVGSAAGLDLGGPEEQSTQQNRRPSTTGTYDFGGGESEESGPNITDVLGELLTSLEGDPEQARAVFGSVPEAIPYNPIDVTKSLLRNLAGNVQAAPSAKDLTEQLNKGITEQALARLESLVPGQQGIRGQISGNIAELAAGRLPFEDVMDIVSDRSELSANLGTPGASAPATLRDLGVSRLAAMQQGSSMFEQIVQSSDQIDPISRHALPQDQLLGPEARLSADVEQATLEQQAEQSAANLAAQPDPVARGLAQLRALSGIDLGGAEDVSEYNPLTQGPFNAASYANFLQGAGLNVPT